MSFFRKFGHSRFSLTPLSARAWSLQIFFALWVIAAFVFFAKMNLGADVLKQDTSEENSGANDADALRDGKFDASERLFLPPNLVEPNPETNPITPPKWHE